MNVCGAGGTREQAKNARAAAEIENHVSWPHDVADRAPKRVEAHAIRQILAMRIDDQRHRTSLQTGLRLLAAANRVRRDRLAAACQLGDRSVFDQLRFLVPPLPPRRARRIAVAWRPFLVLLAHLSLLAECRVEPEFDAADEPQREHVIAEVAVADGVLSPHVVVHPPDTFTVDPTVRLGPHVTVHAV